LGVLVGELLVSSISDGENFFAEDVGDFALSLKKLELTDKGLLGDVAFSENLLLL